jgi:Transglutaminase-like superfamily
MIAGTVLSADVQAVMWMHLMTTLLHPANALLPMLSQLISSISLPTTTALSTTTSIDDNKNNSKSHASSTACDCCCSNSSSSCCGRSNATHVVWRQRQDASSRNNSRYDCEDWQTLREAQRDARIYLRRNCMSLDLPFLETIGFRDDEDIDDDDVAADGLEDGLVGATIQYAIQAKQEFASYTDAIPKDIWNEYVLNYANLNEARTNIRQLLWNKVIAPLFLSAKNDTATTPMSTVVNGSTSSTSSSTSIMGTRPQTISESVRLLNTHGWTMLGDLVFVSSQTPAIFDPMSVIAFGYASCTGFAILFVQILRTAGVPARVAGTAAWNNNRTKGNHNWVEVYGDDGKWHFLEPSPGQNSVDSLEREPCTRWFCQPSLMNHTRVYAAALEKREHFFPLAWEWDCQDVPAIDRTAYYDSVCQSCGFDEIVGTN